MHPLEAELHRLLECVARKTHMDWGYGSWEPGQRNLPPSEKAWREYRARQRAIYNRYLEPLRPQIERVLRKLHRLGITSEIHTEQTLDQPLNITPTTHMPTPPNEKREARNGLKWDSLQETLDSGTDAARKGAQQFFTPQEFARAFMAPIPMAQRRAHAVDLEMGAAALLLASRSEHLMGCDVDKSVAHKPDNASGFWSAYQADITLLAPILAEIGWKADFLALNPPFSINLEASRLAFLGKSPSPYIRNHFALASKGGTINSGIATLLMALEFCSTRGEGFIILSEVVAKRYIGNATDPCRRHLWLWLSIPGSIFPGCNSIDTAVLYFARDHQRADGPKHIQAVNNTPEAVREALAGIEDERYLLRAGIEVKYPGQDDHTTWSRWEVARDEYKIRHGGKPRPFNIWLDPDTGVIRRHLTPFQTLTGTVPKKLVESLHLLEGQSPMALVVQKNTREALQRAVDSTVWTVDSKLPPAVEAAIRDYHSSRAPFYPLSEVQRIGYVDESETLLCRRNGLPGIEAGKRYEIFSQTTKIGRHKARLNFDGEEETLFISGQDLVITIRGDNAKNGTDTSVRFMQFPDMELDATGETPGRNPNTHDLQKLIEHFEIPEVADIASLRTEEYRANIERLRELERRFGVKLKNFQRDDLARSALMDGAILAWSAGLGKTWAMFLRPFITGSKRVLIVSPDTLHAQTITLAKEKFGIEVRSLMSQEDFDNDADLQRALLDRLNDKPNPGTPGPQFWITSYTALGMNGADEWEPKLVDDSLQISQRLIDLREKIPGWKEEYAAGIGTEEKGIRCVNIPSLSRLVADLFDCVEVDEGVRIKSTDTYISLGVRGLRPKHRLLLSATPIKNRLEDIFWLCHWVCGGHKEPTARWPYADDSEAKEQFANEHQLRERNLTREQAYEERTGIRRRFEKRSAEICNIHRLWKLLGPVVIRRRKEDVGEDIAPKIFKPLRVKAGTAQQAVYAFHLQHPPLYSSKGEELKASAQIAVQLNLLRQAALCPNSPNLRGYHNDPRRCSWTDFTTKSAAILGALVEILGRGEQALIASPFQHFNATLHKRLRDSGVTACLCDGTVSAHQRGKMAAAFKQFRYSIMVAGEKAMGEGNSFEQCTNLFLPSLDWAFDINDQTTDRVHRLTSTQPVHIYTCITDNTVDERLYSLYCEKGDSSHLALDGRLFEERTEEVNLAQLLRDAVRDFNPHASTIDEQQVEDEWSALSQKLRIAEQQFREFHPPIADPLFAGADASVCRVTAEDVRAAIAALADRPRKARTKAKAAPKPALRFAEDDATAAQIRALLDQIESQTL
jgi:hypothetical protein